MTTDTPPLEVRPPPPRLDYPFEEPPATGEAFEVAPGVLWIRMPLPFSLAHINLWAIADGERWTLVDTGLRTPETTSAWRQLRDGALGRREVERVIVTHMHPDHIGMAGWITRRTGCRLWMTRLEYLTCRVLVADTGRDAPEDGTRFYRRAGWDDDALEQYRARFGEFGQHTYALPDSYRRIVDGETIRIGWYVPAGKIKNRTARSTEWEEAGVGPQTLIVTARGRESGVHARHVRRGHRDSLDSLEAQPTPRARRPRRPPRAAPAR